MPTNFVVIIKLKKQDYASQHQVACINKSNRSNIYDSIDYIGGKYDDGSSWKFSEGEAISGIESGRDQYSWKKIPEN